MPQQNFNAPRLNGSLYLGDSNAQPTIIPVVSASTDGIALGSGAIAMTSARAMALGNSRASGVDSLAVQIGDNTSTYGASGANSLALGQTSKASAQNTVALGANTQATNFGCVAIGYSSVAQTGAYAVAIGRSNTASGDQSTCLGAYASVPWGRTGVIAHASGRFTTNGDAQEGFSVARIQTTNATATSLLLDGSTTSLKCGTLPNNAAWAIEGLLVAKTSGAGNALAMRITGLIKRGANAAATSIVGSPSVTVMAADAALASATASLSADTTSGALDVQVSGVAATTLNWVFSFKTSEVTF